MVDLWIIGILCAVIFVITLIQARNKPLKQKNTPTPPPVRTSTKKSAPPQNRRGFTFVNVDDFFEQHTISIPENIRDKMDDAIFRGEEYMEIPDYILRKIEETTAKRKTEYKRLNECCARNNNGIALEKAGHVEAAIAEYEENIKGGYRALHSYNRLMILYRKRKDYDNEIRVIDNSIEVFSGDDRFNREIDKWLERRIKAEQLKKKQTKTEL